MSWSFTLTGTFAGVKADIAKMSYLPPALSACLLASVDLLQDDCKYPGSPNGVSISSNGHAGTINELRIHAAAISLDPPVSETTTSSDPTYTFIATDDFPPEDAAGAVVNAEPPPADPAPAAAPLPQTD